MPRERLCFLGAPMPRSNLLVGELPDLLWDEGRIFRRGHRNQANCETGHCNGQRRLRQSLFRDLTDPGSSVRPSAACDERQFDDPEGGRCKIEVPQFARLDEARVLRIAPSKGLAPDVDAQEVHEHVMPANSRPFLPDEICHSDDFPRPHLHRGLLASLSDHGLLYRLSELDGSSGDTPPTLGGRVSSTDEEDLRAAEHDRANRGDRARWEFVRRHSRSTRTPPP